MKFGVLGWSVAHEMTHGYDETGSLLDAEGNLFAWWDTATRVEFTSRGECFTEQYANFTGDSSNKTVRILRIKDNCFLYNIIENFGCRKRKMKTLPITAA